MPADATIVSMRSDTAEAPAARRNAPREQPERPPREQPQQPPREQPQRPIERPSQPEKAPQTPRRHWVRSALFALLPLALIAGGYWYVTGGRVMSTDDAYVEADKVGISTDVSGIVKEIDVGNNQHVEGGQILFRLDDLPFRFALERAEAQVGMVRNDLNALKANYRDMQAQIKQAQDDIDYYDREFHRQQDLASKFIASQQTFDTARRNLQNAQQKLASLNQQLAAIAANLNGDPDIPVDQYPRYLDALAQRDEAARQLAHSVVKAPFAGIVTNVPSIAPGKYLQASTTAFYLVATDYVWIDANPKETQLTHVRPGQSVTRHGREHQPGCGAGVLAAACAEHERQLGEGRAAHPNARSPRHQRQEPAAVARRNERRGRCRYRASARLAPSPDHPVRRRPEQVLMAADRAGEGIHRAAITVCVILATIMQALDTTIANIALPYIQGSVSASQDQINWVLTSYIVAAAIMTPPTGFLAGRFGRKRLFLVAVAGFTVASMLCGMAQSLE